MDNLLELLRSSLPNAVGEIMAVVVVALVGAIIARTLKRRRPSADGSEQPQEQGAKAQGVDGKVDLHPRVNGRILKRGSLDVGSLVVDASLKAGLTAGKSEVKGPVDNLTMKTPGGFIEVQSSERNRSSEVSRDNEAHDGN